MTTVTQPTKPTASQTAAQIVAMCREYGFTINAKPTNGVVTISRMLAGIDRNADFAHAESQAWSILAMIPTVEPGSTWGTDGLSVGGLSALNSGRFTMNKSGCSKRVLSAVAKLA